MINPERVLVVQTAFLGDVILTTPLIKAVRGIWPGCRLSFMGTPGGCAVLRGLSGLDELIVFDKRGLDRGTAGLRARAAELKEKEFDLAICAHRSTRTAVLTTLSGIPLRAGFETAAFPWLYNLRAPRNPSDHEVMRNLSLLAPLGGPPDGFEPELCLPPVEPEAEPAGMDSEGPRVAFCPGSVWATKRWPAEGFARLAEMLVEDYKASVYLTGSGDDRQAAAEVLALCRVRGKITDLTGKTDLSQWLSVMGRMDLAVTNDSSPTHVACALEIPVVTVFGPTASGQGFAPWSSKSRVVEVKGLPCRPCGAHGADRCPEGHFKCMELIRPQDVLAAVDELLSGG